jgi:hypothetical protein
MAYLKEIRNQRNGIVMRISIDESLTQEEQAEVIANCIEFMERFEDMEDFKSHMEEIAAEQRKKMN